MSIVYQHTVSPVCVLHLWYISGWAASWGPMCLWRHLAASGLPAVSRRSRILGVSPHTTHTRGCLCVLLLCLSWGLFRLCPPSH